MLHRLEMAQGYVPPVVEAVENCSTCFHCDGNTAPICGWLRDTRLHHNILPLPDICTYFLYIHSTCKEIFPTWVDAEERLTELVEESAYGCHLSLVDGSLQVSLVVDPLIYNGCPIGLIDSFPDEYRFLVRQIIYDVSSEYFPPSIKLQHLVKKPHCLANELVVVNYVDGYIDSVSDFRGVTIKEALRRAFGLGLMRSVSVECKITCDGEQFEKK
jgi:hypothetical protein